MINRDDGVLTRVTGVTGQKGRRRKRREKGEEGGEKGGEDEGKEILAGGQTDGHMDQPKGAQEVLADLKNNLSTHLVQPSCPFKICSKPLTSSRQGASNSRYTIQRTRKALWISASYWIHTEGHQA